MGKASAYGLLLDFGNDAPAQSSQTYGVRWSNEWTAGNFAPPDARSGNASQYGSNPASFDLGYQHAELAVRHDRWTVAVAGERAFNDARGFTTPLATLHAFQRLGGRIPDNAAGWRARSQRDCLVRDPTVARQSACRVHCAGSRLHGRRWRRRLWIRSRRLGALLALRARFARDQSRCVRRRRSRVSQTAPSSGLRSSTVIEDPLMDWLNQALSAFIRTWRSQCSRSVRSSGSTVSNTLWRTGSSQLLPANWCLPRCCFTSASWRFSPGTSSGLLTPIWVWDALGVPHSAKQMLAIVAGGVAGVLCLCGRLPTIAPPSVRRSHPRHVELWRQRHPHPADGAAHLRPRHHFGFAAAPRWPKW